MTMSFELQLVIGIAGFYLFDSAMLLYANEIVFEKNSKKWSYLQPESGVQILRKSLYIPNPLLPANPLFRVSWRTSSTCNPEENLTGLYDFIRALNPLRHTTRALLSCMLIALPFVAFYFGTGSILLMTFIVIYSIIITMLFLIYIRLSELHLTKKQFLKLAFDSLACPPFALNLVRKITLNKSLPGDPILFAKNSLCVNDFSQLTAIICAKLDEDIAFEDSNSDKKTELINYRNKIADLLK